MGNLVSIIVPIYNVVQYLDRCLNSLVRQTHSNIEILLIDDGSTDGSGELCDLWQSQDPRVRAFHKPNGGLSDARNHGLERASGDYVCFVDSDDWYDLRFVEVLLGALLDTDSDLAECDHVCTDGSDPAPENGEGTSDYRVFEGRDCFLHFLTEDFFVSVCTKLYRRGLLENQPFRKGVYHEDEFWTYRIFSKARKVCRVNYTGYYYYQRQGSIVHTRPSYKRISDAFDAAKERRDFIELHYPEYAPVAYSKMLKTCMYLYRLSEQGDFPEKPALQAELLSFFRILFRKYLRGGQYQPFMWRFCFFRLSPKAYYRLFC